MNAIPTTIRYLGRQAAHLVKPQIQNQRSRVNPNLAVVVIAILFLYLMAKASLAETLPPSAPTISIHYDVAGITLSLRGQTNERFVIEWKTNVADLPPKWSELTRVDGRGLDRAVSVGVDAFPSVRFFKARREERPIACDLAGCEREFGTNACPAYGPPDDPAVRDGAIPNGSTPIKTIRLLFHILAYDDGTSPVVSEDELFSQVSTLNHAFRPVRIQFVYTSRIARHTFFRDLDQPMNLSPILRQMYGTNQATRLNIFVPRVEDLSFGGQAVFPWRTNDTGVPTALTNGGGVVVNGRRVGPGEVVLAHEIGHALGLWHTHRGASDDEVSSCTACWERAAGGDLDRTGDFCSDTAPTPMLENGQPAGTWDDCSKANWPGNGLGNYMSRFPHFAGRFTPQQAGRMHAWIINVLSGWLDTETPATPSDFRVAADSFGEITLSWIDNSWNETGFRVERSSDGVSFSELAVLPPNATGFTDLMPLAETQNFYRISAVNSGWSSYLASAPRVVPPRLATVFCVNPMLACPPNTPSFTTIHQAAAAVTVPTIIRIRADTYQESLLISNKVLRLEPVGGRVLIKPQ